MPAVRPAVAAALLLGACADPTAVPAPAVAAALRPARAVVTEPAAGPWARVVEGETGPGAEYALHVPRAWNGTAVYYAHGFRDAGTEVGMRDQDEFYAIREALGAQGYAVAASSYARNGFAVKDGAQRTHQLRGLLAAQLPAPAARSLLVGHSLGAAIALDLAERYPAQYDGALLMCGMVGGTLLQTQYLGHVRALASHFFPSIPGSPLVASPVPITIPMVANAALANPAGLFAIASTRQTPLPHAPGPMLVQTLIGSLYGALSFHSRGIDDVLALTHGQTPFGNAGETYARGATVGPLPPAALDALIAGADAAVARFTLAPSAEAYLSHHFTPTGNLQRPVVTVHNRFDPAVPYFHVDALRARAVAAGAADHLLERAPLGASHCAISAAQALSGFGELAQWVATGQKPAP
ncbi:alpha/beta hydrolase [Roseisolibacter sp. H3M3-2]|uniref:serine aminopeptidase domain-containing protein n=1 Tax=Roseisolibacter sp. H3M3-2 TaxID=3031323 RepID=UPI0023DA3858|nr:alpha/beta hydrolase [Roseisolibacter sp. H3M3-2]MDF1504899.1 alpha/beta hydrolase [Roseisolibacter sp. H3M3-2]